MFPARSAASVSGVFEVMQPAQTGFSITASARLLFRMRSGSSPLAVAYSLASAKRAGDQFDPPKMPILPADTAPETCFGSKANALRRQRAETLAAERGVSAHNIATAWVLGQSFPSLALIGPRSPGEIVSTLPGAALALSAAEVLWLNLEADAR